METKISEPLSEEGKKSKIEDYLNGPRKKRKNYIIFATRPDFNRDLFASMYHYVAQTYPQLSVSKPRTPQELTRQFGRNISLLIIDDEFDEIHVVLGLVKALKEKRREETIPVLFLTRSANKLIEIYHSELLNYHDSDEYFYYPGAQKNALFATIKSGVDHKNQKVGRRYKINIDLNFLHLAKDQHKSGTLVDLSMYGAILLAEQNTIFRRDDQVKLNIPVIEPIAGHNSDFIKIAAKVRRVFISGSKVSLSFEHMTPSQEFALGNFLTKLVTEQMQRGGVRLRAALPQQLI